MQYSLMRFLFSYFTVGGQYVYCGLRNKIISILKYMPNIEQDVIELSVNIDGLPVYKSKNSCLWPIQCSIVNIPTSKPFIVALYYSHHKPQNLDFLKEFVNELKELMDNGICINDGSVKKVLLRCFVCDAPAKALIKGTIQFNGRYGCDYCDVQGQYHGSMSFLYVGNNRTNESFRQRSNPEHHRSSTPLLELDIDMVKDFPIDPMHCIDLGVTKKLIMQWKEGPLEHRLSAGQLNVISNYNCALRQFMPSNFNRKPRGLQEIKMWKATEFRTFLMYTGPVILKYNLSHEMYKHFMSLSIAVCFLYSEKLVSKHKAYAHSLLEYFVEEAKKKYGERFISYNVHCLLHLAEFAEQYECLQTFSAYKFENNMSSIKKSVRGSGRPIEQVYRRLAEKELNQSVVLNPLGTVREKKSIKTGTCWLMKNGKYCIAHEVQENGHILCEIYNKTLSFYTVPCDSRLLGIHKVSKVNTEMQHCMISDMESAAIYIPLSLFNIDQSNAAVVIPLFHSL